MTHTSENEKPGFKASVNELPIEKDNGSDETLERIPEAAEERKEGGYQ